MPSRKGARDRRQRLLRLTAKGQALEAELAALQRARFAKAYREAGPEAVAGFRQVLIGPVGRTRTGGRVAPDCQTMMPEAKEADDADKTVQHLLIVDDDTRIRTLLQRYLSENGYRVTAAKDAAEARQLMTSLDFDFIVLDVMMPGEDGFSLTQGDPRKVEACRSCC